MKGVKRKYPQLTSEWQKRRQIIPGKEILSKKEQAANKPIIREIVNELVPTIILQSFPIFAHLKNTQNIGRVSKNKPPTKKGNIMKRLQTKKALVPLRYMWN